MAFSNCIFKYFIIKFLKYMVAQILILACPILYQMCILKVHIGTDYCEHDHYLVSTMHFHVLKLKNPTACSS